MENDSSLKLYDLHCHVLPGMDDGCRDVLESIQLLQKSRRQNAAGLIATPHYYPQESVDAFLQRRQAAFEQLKLNMELWNIAEPKLCLGAEVAWRSGISREPKLAELCLGGSDYLLLELPFSKWDSSVLREAEAIIQVRGLTPIIAHLERYAHFQDRKTLQQLYGMNLLIQMNAEYCLDPKTARKARKLIEDGIVQVLGSDSHNPDRRPPNLGPAVQKLKAGGGSAALRKVLKRNQDIFTQAYSAAPADRRA